jgi:UDP-N-acetylglucosamine 2-epimerase (non-hydrolysing)
VKVIHIVGARPNFVKIASIVHAARAYPQIEQILVHTGQHYDEKLSKLFFDELDIPAPDVNLEVGSASHAVQTARIMMAFEPVVLEHRPDLVLVVGDVNSTVACALVAAKLGAAVAHVEAGLRSFDRSMPEEINRVLTDAISDLLFVTEQSGYDNLVREGIDPSKIHFVGHVMIDTLLANRQKAERSPILEQLGLRPDSYAVLTMHRPSNTDLADDLTRMLGAIEQIQGRLPVVFPIHPRTRAALAGFGLDGRLAAMHNLIATEPLGYLDFLKLMAHAKLVLTDSGGIQEETTILQVPCLTLRPNTERPVTVTEGTNTIVGTDPERIVAAAYRVLDGQRPTGRVPKLWDGRSGQRIIEVLLKHFVGR